MGEGGEDFAGGVLACLQSGERGAVEALGRAEVGQEGDEVVRLCGAEEEEAQSSPGRNGLMGKGGRLTLALAGMDPVRLLRTSSCPN